MNEDEERRAAANRQRVAEAAALRQQEEAEAEDRERRARLDKIMLDYVLTGSYGGGKRGLFGENTHGRPDTMKKQSGKPDTQPIKRYRRRKVRRGK